MADSSTSAPATSGFGSEYLALHQTSLQEAVRRALTQALLEEAPNPAERVGELLIMQSKSSGGTTPPVAVSSATPTNTEATGPTEWTLAAWLGSTGSVTSALAGTLLGQQRQAKQSELAFVRALGAKFQDDPAAGRAHVLSLLQRGGALEATSAAIWSGIEQLVKARAVTGEELQAKFTQEGAGLLSYGSLSTFYGGLGGIIGDPHPKVASLVASPAARRHPRCLLLSSKPQRALLCGPALDGRLPALQVDDTIAYEHTKLGDAHE